MEFGYPVYNYDKYRTGKCGLIKYDKKKVLKKVNKVLKNAKKKSEFNMKQSAQGRQELVRGYKNMSKKELKKILKKKDLYEPGMDKTEMIDTLELFM
jgi:hypothetical protein